MESKNLAPTGNSVLDSFTSLFNFAGEGLGIWSSFQDAETLRKISEAQALAPVKENTTVPSSSVTNFLKSKTFLIGAGSGLVAIAAIIYLVKK